jgi:hypothetical protein
MRCVAKPVWYLLAITLLMGTATVSHAQEADAADDLRLETDTDEDLLQPEQPPAAGQPVLEDPEPVVRRRRVEPDPYTAQGLPGGAFRLFPSLEIATEVSTNPRRTLKASGLDVGLGLTPQLRFESDWVRHSLTGSASINGRSFLRDEDLRSVAGSLDTNFRLDVRRTTTADFAFNYDATSTELGDSELPATAAGSRLDHEVGASAAVTHDFGGLEGRLRLGAAHSRFGDVDLVGGGEESNSDRDFTELSLSARGTLQTGAKIQPFGEVAYEQRIFNQKRDRNGVKRNSHGLRVAAGVSIDDDPIWTGDLAATLELRDYSDNSLNTVIAPGLSANVTWRPTDLTRFEFNAGVDITDTVDAGVAATQTWNIGYAMIHSLWENLDVRAGNRASFDRASGETDVTFTSSVGIDWTLNPQMVLSAGYEGTFFRGDGPTDDYDDHRLLTSIVLRR